MGTLLRLIFFSLFASLTYAGSHGVASLCVETSTDYSSLKIPWNSELAALKEKKHNEQHESFLGEHKHGDEFSIQWSGAEHLQLGDLGFTRACERSGLQSEDFCLLNGIYRNDHKTAFSYGQILALGDFYTKVDDAFFERGRSKSIGKIFQCIDKEGKVHDEQRTHPEVDYPDCTWVNILYGGDYINVVTKNYDHFAWDNVKAYVKNHERALAYARAAGRMHRRGKYEIARKVLNKALYINAFADHFLTDAFPAGHLRVPRREVKNWAKKNTNRLLGSFIGDGLSMLMHDYEGKDNYGNEIGMEVENSMGIRWITASDTYLNACATEEDYKIAMPLTAVEVSVGEIFDAYQNDQIPQREFAALWYVPYPNNPGLLDRWQSILLSSDSDEIIAGMRDSLPGPVKWIIPQRYIRRLIDHMPDIINQFRERMEKEYLESPRLQKRIPQQFFQSIN